MSKIRVVEMIDRTFLGGGQMTVLTLARNLDRGKFEVLVATEEEGPLAEALDRAGIRRLPVKIRKKNGIFAVPALSAKLRENAVDILHTHGGVAGLFGRMAARRAGVSAIVHTVHGIHYLHYRNPLIRRASLILERRLARFTDAVIFVSASDLEKGVALGLACPGRARLIRNGVEFAGPNPGFEPADKRKELGIGKGPLVAAVSRLHRQKGLVFLIRAMAEVVKILPDARAALVGGGELEARLKQEAKRLGIEDRVLFLGERKDASEILAAADIFVLPSLWEGLPYAVIEAAAAGKPIIASDIDGVRELIREGENGVLVQPGKPADLAGAIVRLIQDPAGARVLAETARKEIPPAYSVDRMIRETEALYLEISRR